MRHVRYSFQFVSLTYSAKQQRVKLIAWDRLTTTRAHDSKCFVLHFYFKTVRQNTSFMLHNRYEIRFYQGLKCYYLLYQVPGRRCRGWTIGVFTSATIYLQSRIALVCSRRGFGICRHRSHGERRNHSKSFFIGDGKAARMRASYQTTKCGLEVDEAFLAVTTQSTTCRVVFSAILIIYVQGVYSSQRKNNIVNLTRVVFRCDYPLTISRNHYRS